MKCVPYVEEGLEDGQRAACEEPGRPDGAGLPAGGQQGPGDQVGGVLQASQSLPLDGVT